MDRNQSKVPLIQGTKSIMFVGNLVICTNMKVDSSISKFKVNPIYY